MVVGILFNCVVCVINVVIYVLGKLFFMVMVMLFIVKFFVDMVFLNFVLVKLCVFRINKVDGEISVDGFSWKGDFKYVLKLLVLFNNLYSVVLFICFGSGMLNMIEWVLMFRDLVLDVNFLIVLVLK